MIMMTETGNNTILNLDYEGIKYFTCFIIVCVVIMISFLVIFKLLKNIVPSIEDGVMIFSFVAAMACLLISIFFKEVDKSINILSFFSSFVFSWLLTKKSSKGEFKERQQEIAKTSYRHIGDVKKTTLVTRDRLLELKNKKDNEISKSDIDGILDDIEIILQCIATNEGDWQDMVSEKDLKQMKKYIDPEDENVGSTPSDNKGVNQPTLDSFKALQDTANNLGLNIQIK